MQTSTKHSSGILRLYAGLWTHSRGVRPSLILAYVMLVTSECIKLALPWLGGLVLDTLQRKGIGGIAEAAIQGEWMLACLLASWALHGPARVLERNAALHIRSSVAAWLTARFLDAPLRWHKTQHCADSSGRLLQGSRALHQFAEGQYLYLQSAVSLFGPMIVLCMISPVIGATAVMGYCAIGLISMRFDHILTWLGVQQSDSERRYATTLIDFFGKFLTVLALRRRGSVEKAAANRLADTFHATRRLAVYNEVRWAAIDILANVLVLVLVGLDVWLRARHSDSNLAGGVAVGGVFVVYEYARRADSVVTTVVNQLAVINGQVAGYAAAEPIRRVAQEVRVERALATPWRKLELRSVTYAHGGRAPAVLREVDLTLERGRRYALVGSSGAGKTTLLHLLAGLEAPGAGGIWRDGDLLDMKALRGEATMIPQQAEVFEGSLKHNLLMGEEGDPEELAQALEAVDARHFVLAPGKGWESAVTENGGNLSGGQRQRLALARGLLAARESSLVLLDEPNSSLDALCERRVLDGIFQAKPDSCFVVALHGLHLLDMFDHLVLMEDGRIAEAGQTSTLLKHSQRLHALLAARGGGGSDLSRVA